MQAPTVFELGDEVLQVLEVCEPVEEIRDAIIQTGETNPRSPTAASSGLSTKSNQVLATGPTG